MKKTLFNADFEESKKFVTRQYALNCLDIAVNKQYVKYAIRFLLISLTASALFLVSVLAWEKILCIPLTKYLLPASEISALIFLILFTLYAVSLFRIRKKKMLYYSAVCYAESGAMPFIWFECLAIFCTVPVYVVGIAEVGFLWFIVGCFITSWMVYKEYYDLLVFLYDRDKPYNAAFRLLGAFLKTLKKLGWIFILLLTICRNFLRGQMDSRYDVLFRDKPGIIIPALGLIIPLLLGILLLAYLLINVQYSFVNGFYLRKYFEEYRVLYEFTKDEWSMLKISAEKLTTLIQEEKEDGKKRLKDKISDLKKRRGYEAKEASMENIEEPTKED